MENNLGDKLSTSRVVNPVVKIQCQHWQAYPVKKIFSIMSSWGLNIKLCGDCIHDNDVNMSECKIVLGASKEWTHSASRVTPATTKMMLKWLIIIYKQKSFIFNLFLYSVLLLPWLSYKIRVTIGLIICMLYLVILNIHLQLYVQQDK